MQDLTEERVQEIIKDYQEMVATIKPEDYMLTFGKFEGMSIGEIWEERGGPQYLFWAWETLTETVAHKHIEKFLADEGVHSKDDLPWREGAKNIR